MPNTSLTTDPFNGLRFFEDAVTRLMSEPRGSRPWSPRGSRKFEKDEKTKGYHRIERSYGDFVRSFALPPTVEADKVAADYKNGVLTITLPKKEAAKPRQVKVAIN